jgi:hypothetical protein
MNDISDIRLINTHAKSVGCHDDTYLVALPFVLDAVFLGIVESGMIVSGFDACSS